MASSDLFERARVSSGYGQADVAAALGVSQAMVSYWESGKRKPNDRQLAALAHLYRIEVEDLLEDRFANDPDFAEMLFRGADKGVPEGALPGLRAFISFLDAYARLAHTAKFNIAGLVQSPFASGVGYRTADDARRKAEAVRAHLRRGLGPIGDMDEVCELLGVTVYRASLGDDLTRTISGAFLNHPDVGFAILVNLDMTPGRRRFTIAHELAHTLFDSSRDQFVVSTADRSPQERFADLFAGELLMPSEGIRTVMEEHGMGSRLTDPADVIHLQRLFNVSYATCLVRLRQARILSPERYEQFKTVQPLELAQVLGYDVADEEHRPRPSDWRLGRFPRRFLRLLREAVGTGQISHVSAAALTDLTIEEIAALVEAPSGLADQDSMESRELREHEDLGVYA